MSLFALQEYWRYRRAAMGRHGTHSPAVYRFIEEGLCPPERAFSGAIPYESPTGEKWRPDPLMRRVAHHFRFDEIFVPARDGRPGQAFRASHAPAPVPGTDAYRRLHDWQELPPELWLAGLTDEIGDLDVLAVHSIHAVPAQAAAWNELRMQPRVTLSLDLFKVGLLFFASHFKVPQHFVLKFPH